MYILNVCENPDILRIIYFILKIFDIVFIIIPIGLIVMIIIDLMKAVTSGEEKVAKTSNKTIINRIIFAIAIFFVPTIVSVIMNLIGNVGGNSYITCLKNANKEDIERLTKENQSNTGNSNNSSNNNNNGFTNYGNSGTSKTYFAPIQTSTFYISNASSTPGCSNDRVFHDINEKEGTPIYAGIDGTAKFSQKYCNVNGVDELYSYGNMVTITADDGTGTYIYYAHLQKFPENVINSAGNNVKYIEKSCDKTNKDGGPCPSSSCSSNGGKASENNIVTLKVKKGDLIGYLGNTGNSEAPHLHVEIHLNGQKECILDPWREFGMR